MNEQQNTLLQHFARSSEQRHALQIALYNTTFLALFAACVAGFAALYNMLYMFLSPMMWAVLVGTILFPFKRKVTLFAQGWLDSLEERHTPLTVGLLLIPYHAFVSLSECIYGAATGVNGLHYLLAYIGIKLLSYQRTFMYVLAWLGRLYLCFNSAIDIMSRKWVFPLMFLYFLGYFAWISVQTRESINKKVARTVSIPLWLYALSFMSSLFGAFRGIVFGGTAIVLGLLASGAIKPERLHENVDTVAGQTLLDEKERLLVGQEKGREVSQNETIEPSSIVGRADAEAEPELVSRFTGNDLISTTASLVGLLWIVRHDSALLFILFPLLFAVVVKIGESCGLFAYLARSGRRVWERIEPTVGKFVDITIAGPLRQFVKMMFTSEQWLVTSLRSKMDLLSSIIVMLLLALTAVFGATFVTVQLHSETVYLARLASNVMSSRPDWLSSALNYTEERLEEQNIDLDDYVEQAYQQGRTWLAVNARSLVHPKDSKRADELEKQVKQIVDNVYRMWEERNEEFLMREKRDIDGDGVPDEHDVGWLQKIRHATDLTALQEELTNLIKNNVDTIIGVANSVWGVLKVNFSVLCSILSAIGGLLLGFGMELLNFFIEFIVFLTMVYYLLASSGDRWLPLEYLSRIGSFIPSLSTPQQTDTESSPVKQREDGENECQVSPHGFTTAIEDAIFGVFGLSFKMAFFYALYTYLIHSLFDLNIVFVPSLLASLFAAVPLFPPWAVAICGVVELSLVRGEITAGLFFALLSVAPLTFADSRFYSEVKGMHPYVTGLSVIGGMYWLGLEGALIGPLILCSFLVLLNLYSQLAVT